MGLGVDPKVFRGFPKAVEDIPMDLAKIREASRRKSSPFRLELMKL
jgi:hypothetical protein